MRMDQLEVVAILRVQLIDFFLAYPRMDQLEVVVDLRVHLISVQNHPRSIISVFHEGRIISK